MSSSLLIDQLIEALRYLPGVGPKTAQRMAIFMLKNDRHKALHLAHTLITVMNNVKQCSHCRTFSESEICNVCADTKRNASMLCIVETPADMMAIEQSGSYKGHYFVLMGHLSPIEGIGPQEIGMPQLQARLEECAIQEIIIATNHTIEGEATAHYIVELAKPLQIKTTRIAFGIPSGSELEYVDSRTLAEALMGRRDL